MHFPPSASHSVKERSSRIRIQAVVLVFSAVLLSIFCACGGSGKVTPTPTPTPQAFLQIAPPPGGSAVIATGTVQFSATVTGTLNTAVNWSVAEAGGGTIDASGLYTAPAAAGTFHVVATAQADTTKTASLAVTVTIDKPAFSSNPPLAAQEGSTYSYTLAVNDPAGKAVSFTLQGPGGATISGTNLTWTPTAEQSRVTNDFTVTCTSAAGGVASQSWSLTPTGTIQISDIDHYWNVDEDSHVQASPHPNDLSDSTNYAIAALVPQPDGSVVQIKGVGKSDGTATIANVPGGQYWLQIRPNEMYWTGTSAFDYGSDYVGRAPVAPITTTLAWNLSNLVPWDSSLDSVVLQVPTAGVSYAATTVPDDGSVHYQGSETYSGQPVDTGEGDAAYVLQKRHQSVSSVVDVISVAAMAAVPELELDRGGDPGTASASLAPLSSAKTLELELASSAYAKWAGSVNPNFTFSGGSGELFLQPLVTDLVAQGGVPLLDFTLFDVSADQDLGSYDLGSPFPSLWPMLFFYSQGGSVTASVPDGQSGTVDLWASLTHVGASLPSGSQPDEPEMSPVQGPQINGVSLFSATSVSGPAVLSWTAPSGTTPAGYSIAIDPVEKDEYGYYVSDGFDLFTTSTSMTVPTGLLTSGKMYVFTITAVADAIANFATAPWRSGYPLAWADAISGVVSYSEVAPSGHAVIAKVVRSPRRTAADRGQVAGRFATRPQVADLQYRRSHARRAMALQSALVRPQRQTSNGTR